jgi:hypothetical protein
LGVSGFSQAQNLLPPTLLPGTPVVGPAAGNQRSPAIGRGATTSLLVFEDARAGDSDLFGVRLDASGAPIDAIPFPIAKDPGDQTAPSVVWNGQNWLVVYTSQVDPGSGYWTSVYQARRVSPLGQALDAAPITVNDVYSGEKYFGLGSDGQNWVVLYMTADQSLNTSLRAKRIAPNGTVLDPSGVLILGDYGSELSATFASGNYLFAWRDFGASLKARRFTPQLQPIDLAPVTLPVGLADVTMTARLASNGSEFFVAWMRQTPTSLTEILGTRLDANLNAVNAAPIPISGAPSTWNQTNPRAVWDGSQWIVSWFSIGELDARAARVTAAGAVLDPGGVALPDGSPNYLYEPALGALPAGGALFAWHDIRFAGFSLYDVFGIPFGATGVVGAERCFSVGSEALRSPRVTPGPNQYLVTYRAEAANGSRVLAQRVDALGTPLDAQPIEVAAASTASLFAGGAAWNGSVYLVTWSDSTQGKIFAKRMLPDGSFLDPAPIFVLLGGGADAAALGADFLVTGLRAPGSPQFVASYGARVRGSDGAVLDNPALLIGQSYAARARVVALGGKWLVVTERHFSHDDNASNVLFHFVTPSGVVSPEAIAANAVNIQNWGSTDVASSGSSALVVCQSGSNWTNCDVFARRILPDGSMPSPLFNVTGSVGLGQSRATVGWTGAEYVVAFETFENSVWFYDFEPDVYGARVSEAGSLVDATGFAVWNGDDYEMSADAGGLGNGKALFAASTYEDGAYGSFRISVRSMRPIGLTNYGVGTPGCDGLERMDASGSPKINNPGFQLFCDRAPAGQLGLCLISDLQDVAGSDSLGIDLLTHVGFIGATELIALDAFSDGLGFATSAVPIPNNPLLVAKSYFAQNIWLWSPTACVPSTYGLSSSDGLEIAIQAP